MRLHFGLNWAQVHHKNHLICLREVELQPVSVLGVVLHHVGVDGKVQKIGDHFFLLAGQIVAPAQNKFVLEGEYGTKKL